MIIYRNKIKQEPGINSENIEWMFNEANKQQLNEESRQGGIVFDEMAIPCDLQIDKKGDVVELCGLVEKGEESDVCTVLRSGKKQTKNWGLMFYSFYFYPLQDSDSHLLIL